VKNITLSADEKVIEAARQEARRQKTTLNSAFRDWLERYARNRQGKQRLQEYRRLMDSMKTVTSGRCFSRDEMNAR
jgi:flagellar motility protein MotE (MotC chaperone)